MLAWVIYGGGNCKSLQGANTTTRCVDKGSIISYISTEMQSAVLLKVQFSPPEKRILKIVGDDTPVLKTEVVDQFVSTPCDGADPLQALVVVSDFYSGNASWHPETSLELIWVKCSNLRVKVRHAYHDMLSKEYSDL